MHALKDLLSKGEVVISFIKDDGTERVMRATTNPALINYVPKSTSTKPRKPGPANIIKVWDLDISQWRSIREDRVLGWE